MGTTYFSKKPMTVAELMAHPLFEGWWLDDNPKPDSVYKKVLRDEEQGIWPYEANDKGDVTYVMVERFGNNFKAAQRLIMTGLFISEHDETCREHPLMWEARELDEKEASAAGEAKET